MCTKQEVWYHTQITGCLPGSEHLGKGKNFAQVSNKQFMLTILIPNKQMSQRDLSLYIQN